jgi:DNA-binding response OmpR family regulator
MVESTRLTNYNTKFVVITGTSAEEQLCKIANISNTFLLKKPVDLGELFAVIKSIIAEIYVEQTKF